jgi:hypothetical protein
MFNSFTAAAARAARSVVASRPTVRQVAIETLEQRRLLASHFGGSGGDYGFADWKITDAEWQGVVDYYQDPGRKFKIDDQPWIPTEAYLEQWRPFANAFDRNERVGVRPDQRHESDEKYMPRNFVPDVPQGLGNVELAELGYLDVTAAPFNVTPDDGQDDTLRLQDAIDFARDHMLVAFLPGGEYNVSGTLFLSQGLVQSDTNRDGKIELKDGQDDVGVRLVGSTINPANRARLVLDANTFTDPNNTASLLHVHSVPTIAPGKSPMHNTQTKTYANLVAHVDLDLNGNAGAFGMSFQAAEGSSINDVNIDAVGAYGGLVGVPGSGGSTFDVTVNGGRVGVLMSEKVSDLTVPVLAGKTNAESQPGPTLTGLTLHNQTEWALATSARGPVTLVGADIKSSKQGPIILARERWAQEPFASSIALIDSKVVYGSTHPDNSVIYKKQGGEHDGRSFYVQNSYFKNASELATPDMSLNANGWSHVAQAALSQESKFWGTPETRTLDVDLDGNSQSETFKAEEPIYIDGDRVADTYFNASFGGMPPSDLTTHHNLGDWESFETSGITFVTDFGASGDGKTDDTAAFQAAIAATPNGGTIFVPKGVYVVTDTLALKRDQTLIGPHHKLAQIVGASSPQLGHFGNNPDPANNGIPIIRTHDGATDRTKIGHLGIYVVQNWKSHDPTPIGTYAMEWRSGRGKVLVAEVKNRIVGNYRESIVLENFYGLDGAFIKANHQKSEKGLLDPTVGWEKPDPEGFGDYGNGPGPNGIYELSPLNHATVQVRGNGGGQWFQFWNHGYDKVDADHRSLLIEDAVDGPEIYHLHIQHKRSDALATIRNSAGVDIYGIKQEVHDTFLEIENSERIRVHGMAGIGAPFEYLDAVFEIDAASDDVLITNMADEPRFFQNSGGLLSPDNRLWEGNILSYVPIQDDGVSAGFKIPGEHRPIMYMRGDPLDLGQVSPPPPAGQAPFGGSPFDVSDDAKLELEDFDLGGQGVAYNHDEDGNPKSNYRPGDLVEVAAKSDASNGHAVGYNRNGEWLEYTVDIIDAGSYDLILSYATGSNNAGDLRVKLDGATIGTFTNLSNTGSYGSFDAITLNDVDLPSGEKVLRLEIIGSAFDLDAITFDRNTVTPPPGGGGGDTIKINFQNPGATTPSGYLADTGGSYGNRNGQTYGWLGGSNNEGRLRTVNGEQRRLTLNHLAFGGNARTWEMSLPNGTYDYVLGMGDPQWPDGTNNVDVEGTSVADADGADAEDTFTGSVTITDGRLTIAPTNSGDNAKIQWLEVTPTGSNGGSNGNVATGGAVDASSQPVSNESAAKAFDGDEATKWLGNMSSSGAWLSYDFAGSTKHVVNGFKITSANDKPARDPRDFILQGSNGGSWSDVGPTFTGETFSSRFQTRTFNVSNSTAYERYRLRIMNNNGSTENGLGGIGLVQIAELELLAGTSSGIGSSTGGSTGGGVFQQASSGLVSMQAEDHTGMVNKTAHKWEQQTGGNNNAHMEVGPDDGQNYDFGFVTDSPRLDFDVNFTKTGTHYVWIHGRGGGANPSTSDSVHAGLNGVFTPSADRIHQFSDTFGWRQDTRNGAVATLNVPSVGVHTVNVWMREAGFDFDQIVLHTSPSYTPSGNPTSSPRSSSQASSVATAPITTATSLFGSADAPPQADLFSETVLDDDDQRFVI